MVPSAAWLIWFVVFGEAEARQSSSFAGLTTGQTIREAFEGVMNTFDALAFGIRPLGILLAIAFAAHLGWRLRQGLVASANVLAWTAALAVWWIGLVYSRGVLADTETFRYRFVGAVFVVLAMIPPTPLKLPDATRSLTAVVAVALVIGVVVLVNRPDIVDQAERDRSIARTAKMMVIVANQGPAIIPDSYQLPPFTLVLNGKQYRELIDRWGYPPDTRPRDVDARLVELADIQLAPVKNPAEPCTEPNSLAYAAKQARVRVQTGATPTTVVLVRFGTGPTRIGDLGPNQTAIMTLPGSFPIGPGRSARRVPAS